MKLSPAVLCPHPLAGAGRRRWAHLRPGNAGLRLSLSAARLRLRLPRRAADDALHGRRARKAEWRDGGAAARQEFLRRDLGAPDRRSHRGRLSRRRAGSDRLLHVLQAARAISSASSNSPTTPTPCCARSASTRAIVVGHSTGGMLAARYALMFPEDTQGLALVNPDRAGGLEGARGARRRLSTNGARARRG